MEGALGRPVVFVVVTGLMLTSCGGGEMSLADYGEGLEMFAADAARRFDPVVATLSSTDATLTEVRSAATEAASIGADLPFKS